MKRTDVIWITSASLLIVFCVMKLTGYEIELDFHLNHHEIENNSRFSEEKDEKAQREREYLQSHEYREYRDWCVKNGLDFLQREKERDYRNGGTFDLDRDQTGNLCNKDRD